MQDAFSREDYVSLRTLVTPEMVCRRNWLGTRATKVSDVRLLEADISESRSEGHRDFTTAAMRYKARELMCDRTIGAVVEGDADRPSETVELWTFLRWNGQDCKLSAIQQPG